MTKFDEKKLDDLLYAQSSCNAMDDLAAAYADTITPFKDAMSKVIAGLVLMTITLQFLYLQYILPAVGCMLVYLGMRTLRTGNRWYRLGWLASLARLIFHTISLLLCVTPYNVQFFTWAPWASYGLEFCFLLFLGLGIYQTGKNSGLAHPKMPTWPIMVWRGILLALAWIGGSGFAILLLMLIAWVLLLKYLLRCTEAVEKAGYSLPASSVWFSGRPLLLAYLVIMALAMMGLSLICSRADFPAASFDKESQIAATDQMVTLRDALTEKGFPAELLSQIADEDLEDLGSPATIKNVLSGQLSQMDESQEAAREFDIQQVGVYNDKNQVKLFTFFVYDETASGNVCNWIRTIHNDNDYDFRYWSEKLTLFYDDDHGIHWHGSPSLSKQKNAYLWFGSVREETSVYGKYSYPMGASQCGGYLTLWAEPTAELTEMLEGAPIWTIDMRKGFSLYATRRWLTLPYQDTPFTPSGVISFDSPKRGEARYYADFTIGESQ
ncbi:MAG: hypothetical protein HFE73_02940 [Firmicutes bacterium]|nr:hypothetical protein [Bacillota bacterium]